MGATKGWTVPGVVYTANPAPTRWTWNAPPEALLTLLLTILLFSTARRGNHWTGVHELLSGTRVVQRNVLRAAKSATPKASGADLVPALSSLRRVGPYAVHTMVGETGSGRLFVGVDPILRRHVWIHEVAPGTPPVNATRRDVSRPGRPYWLAGRRTPTENWDAFEAPDGEPLLSALPTSDWREVHLFTVEPHGRTRRFGSRRDGRSDHSRACLEKAGRAPRSARFPVACPEPRRGACPEQGRGSRTGHIGRRSESRSRRATRGGLEATGCAKPGAGCAALGHEALASTCNRSAASACRRQGGAPASGIHSQPSLTRPSCTATSDGGDAGVRASPHPDRDASHGREIPPGREKRNWIDANVHEVDDVAH